MSHPSDRRNAHSCRTHKKLAANQYVVKILPFWLDIDDEDVRSKEQLGCGGPINGWFCQLMRSQCADRTY